MFSSPVGDALHWVSLVGRCERVSLGVSLEYQPVYASEKFIDCPLGRRPSVVSDRVLAGVTVQCGYSMRRVQCEDDQSQVGHGRAGYRSTSWPLSPHAVFASRGLPSLAPPAQPFAGEGFIAKRVKFCWIIDGNMPCLLGDLYLVEGWKLCVVLV